MNRIKKLFLIIWIINIICMLGLFIYGKILNFDVSNLIIFNYLKITLIIYMIYDYIRIILGESNVDSQLLYVVCIFITIIFIIAGITFIIKLDYFRTSEFLFFIFFSFLFRILSIFANTPNFLLLKEK